MAFYEMDLQTLMARKNTWACKERNVREITTSTGSNRMNMPYSHIKELKRPQKRALLTLRSLQSKFQGREASQAPQSTRMTSQRISILLNFAVSSQHSYLTKVQSPHRMPRH